MKKLLRTAAVGALIAALVGLSGCTVGVTAASEEPAPAAPVLGDPFWVGTVWGHEYVNIRHGPSSDDRIIDYALAGTMFRLTDKEPQNGWYQIWSHGQSAFITKDYLAVSLWQPGAALKLGVVTDPTADTELRKEAAATASSVATAIKYQQFVVLSEEQNGFYAVDYGGQTVYIAAACLSVTDTTIEEALF